MTEAETQTIEVEVVTNTEVTSTGQIEVETVDLSDLDITVAKKEYVITGDDIYIPMLYDDAPQWMKDLVQLVVDVSISSGNQNLINDLSTMLQDFAVSYVPLNQYTQTILDLGDEDTRINALIETLNSNFNDGLSTANAQIISLQLTKASKDEVVAQVIQTIAAQLADGTSNIGSIIGRIDQAIANETSARATSFQVLTSSLEDTNLDVTANANATHVLNTYVGLNDTTGDPNGTGLLADVSTIASDVTMLNTNLQSGAGTWASADSNLTNSLSASIINGDVAVESKFAYNSLLNINGVYKKSGFGLTTNYISGAGTQANPYVSEFWIDASRLKFTNSNQTGQTAPFTIDASGANPQITFNGVVNFNSVTGAIAGGSNLLYNSAPEVGRELEGWSKDYNTVSGFIHSIAAGYGVNIISGGSSILSYVIGTPANSSVFDITQTKRIPVESNTRYEISAYLNCYRCVSEVRVLWINADGVFISESSGTQVSTATATTKISDWGRSTLFATSPSNASSCAIFVRSYVTGTDPHCFVARAYFGKALDNQTGFSTWSEGTGPSKSSSEVVTDINNGNTTTLNGGKITTGSITANQIEAYTITGDKIVANTITGDRINASTITAREVHIGSLTSDRISAGHIGTALTVTAFNPIAALATIFDESWVNGTVVGSMTYNNTLNTPVSILISVAGRTGFTGTYSSSSCSFKIFKDNTQIYSYGWSPANQDAKSMSIVATVDANTVSVFQLRGVKDSASGNGYTLQSNLFISVIGVSQGANA